MDDTEFSRLLHSHLFGSTTAAERRQLAASALESAERAIEFAEVEAIRESLEDPSFRQSIVDSLPDVEPAPAVHWWQQWLRPVFVLPLATGAVAAIALLVVNDLRERDVPPQIAEGPRTPDVAPGAPLPASPSGVTGAPVQAPIEGQPLIPAGTADASSAGLAALFDLPAIRAVNLQLALTRTTAYPADAQATATVTLPGEQRLYAVVRGPHGHVRAVYPVDSAGEVVLAAGTHTFSFPAASRLDGDEAGRFALRVLVVPGTEPLPEPQRRWTWLVEHASFEEVTYDTVTP